MGPLYVFTTLHFSTLVSVLSAISLVIRSLKIHFNASYKWGRTLITRENLKYFLLRVNMQSKMLYKLRAWIAYGRGKRGKVLLVSFYCTSMITYSFITQCHDLMCWKNGVELLLLRICVRQTWGREPEGEHREGGCDVIFPADKGTDKGSHVRDEGKRQPEMWPPLPTSNQYP